MVATLKRRTCIFTLKTNRKKQPTVISSTVTQKVILEDIFFFSIPVFWDNNQNDSEKQKLSYSIAQAVKVTHKRSSSIFLFS